MKKLMMGIVSLTLLLLISACTGDKKESGNAGKEMGEMNHNATSDVPKDLTSAKAPTFPIGSDVIIKANHMNGMENAKGKIVGAYQTTAYQVSYTPADEGEPVKNHKWVIQEELEDASGKTLKPGDKAVMTTNHMKGMNGATATIESAEETTVYMVDYTSTTGEKEKNHKWLTESELVAP